MFDRSSLRLWARVGLSAGALGLLAAAVPVSAQAAAPTPESIASCNGTLSNAPTSDEPNTLSYKFHCNWGITAYSVVVNRRRNDFSTLDDFSPDALMYDTSGAVITTRAFGCEGNVPGNGINCNAGGSYLPAPDYVHGTFDTTAPYCPSIPQGSPALTKPLPQALVQLVVTDSTGAEDGPFRLGLTSACKPVHVAKPSVKQKKKKRKHKVRKAASKRR